MELAEGVAAEEHLLGQRPHRRREDDTQGRLVGSEPSEKQRAKKHRQGRQEAENEALKR